MDDVLTCISQHISRNNVHITIPEDHSFIQGASSAAKSDTNPVFSMIPSPMALFTQAKNIKTTPVQQQPQQPPLLENENDTFMYIIANMMDSNIRIMPEVQVGALVQEMKQKLAADLESKGLYKQYGFAKRRSCMSVEDMAAVMVKTDLDLHLNVDIYTYISKVLNVDIIVVDHGNFTRITTGSTLPAVLLFEVDAGAAKTHNLVEGIKDHVRVEAYIKDKAMSSAHFKTMLGKLSKLKVTEVKNIHKYLGIHASGSKKDDYIADIIEYTL